MKTVLMVGWDTSLNNAGDQILIDTAGYLCTNFGKGDLQVKKLDWRPAEDTKSLKHKSLWFLRMLLCGPWRRKTFEVGNGGRLKYRARRRWYNLYLRRYYKKRMREADAVIVAGGALKYETQEHSFYTECLIQTASDLKLPVMLNAVGIEQYSPTDQRCIELIKTLNHSTVRCITTRDDFESLKQYFVTNPEITIARVADPALWIPETYGVAKQNDSDIVGINLVRENIFSDYKRYNLSNDALCDLYIGLAHELEARGYSWRFFCNGMAGDDSFGKKVVEKMGGNAPEFLLPPPQNPFEYVNMVSGFKAVIGGRMHATITAYALGIPVSAFVWSNKMRFFADQANLGAYFLEGESITPKNLVDAMEQAGLKNDHEKFKKQYRLTTAKYIADFCQSL